MKKYHVILLLFLGILFMPQNTMACGMDNSKHSCEKEITTNNSIKECCCGNNDSKENSNKGCEGNCKDNKCGCTSICTSVSMIFLSDSNYSIQDVYFSQFKKVSFSYTTPSILDGFHSIWYIPKIS